MESIVGGCRLPTRGLKYYYIRFDELTHKRMRSRPAICGRYRTTAPWTNISSFAALAAKIFLSVACVFAGTAIVRFHVDGLDMGSEGK